MQIDLTDAMALADLQRRLITLDPVPDTVEGLLKDIADLVEADSAMAAWLNEGTPLLTTWKAGPQIEAYFFQTFAGVDRDGNIRSTDPALDRINLTRRQMGSGVYHESAFAGRDVIENAAFHREAFRPAGMNHVVGMTTRLAVGEAVFAIGYEDGDAPALANGQAEIILNLLLPAFESAFDALDRKARNLERLERAIAESDMQVSLRGDDRDQERQSGVFFQPAAAGAGSWASRYFTARGEGARGAAGRDLWADPKTDGRRVLPARWTLDPGYGGAFGNQPEYSTAALRGCSQPNRR
jgi:hypothetical protein